MWCGETGDDYLTNIGVFFYIVGVAGDDGATTWLFDERRVS
jgi:hypothetical protein